MVFFPMETFNKILSSTSSMIFWLFRCQNKKKKIWLKIVAWCLVGSRNSGSADSSMGKAPLSDIFHDAMQSLLIATGNCCMMEVMNCDIKGDVVCLQTPADLLLWRRTGAYCNKPNYNILRHYGSISELKYFPECSTSETRDCLQHSSKPHSSQLLAPQLLIFFEGHASQ